MIRFDRKLNSIDLHCPPTHGFGLSVCMGFHLNYEVHSGSMKLHEPALAVQTAKSA